MEKEERRDYCDDPVMGPLRMTAQVERLIELILRIRGREYLATSEEIDLLDDAFNKISNENARGANFGLAAERVFRKLRGFLTSHNAPQKKSPTNRSIN